MHMLGTGNVVQPGLPARSGDAASDGEKMDETAIFEAFLGLALSVPSPDVVIAPGPEGKNPEGGLQAGMAAITGNPAEPGGKTLPVSMANGTQAIAPQPEPMTGLPPLKGEAIALPISNGLAKVDLERIAPPANAAIPAAMSAQSRPQQVALPDNIAEAVLTAAQAATPVINLLAGRQRDTGTQPRAIGEPDINMVAITGPDPADPVIMMKIAQAAPADRPETARLAATAPVSIPAADTGPAGEATRQTRPDEPALSPPKASTSQPEGRETLPRTASLAATDLQAATVPLSSGAEATIAPVSEQRSSQPMQPVSTASVSTRGSDAPAHDFSDIVDRLARAREAEQPGFVRSTIATREFGSVAMQIRSSEGRLHVAMTSTDPGFAPAVLAASAMAGSGQQAMADSSSSQNQQQGQQSALSAQGQAGSDSHARHQQQTERSAQAGPAQQRSVKSSDDDAPPTDPRGEAGSAIYA